MADDFPTDEPSDESPAEAGDDDPTDATGDAQFDPADRTETPQFDHADRTTTPQFDRERISQGARR